MTIDEKISFSFTLELKLKGKSRHIKKHIYAFNPPKYGVHCTRLQLVTYKIITLISL